MLQKIVGYYDFKRNVHNSVQTCISFTQKNVIKELCRFRNHCSENPFIFLQLRQGSDSSNPYSGVKNIIENSYSFFILEHE
jgi:hypothetical protein